MWSSFKNIAEKAKAAAVDLEGQLNESVGVEAHSAKKKTPTAVVEDDEDALNDAWADDFNVDSPIPTPKPLESVAAAPVVPVISKQQQQVQERPKQGTDGHPQM